MATGVNDEQLWEMMKHAGNGGNDGDVEGL